MVKYITELLYRYDCVIVPEFGAFVTNTFTASIDNSGLFFLPPRKEVTFNEQLKQNDGLLINHLSLAFNCTYLEAQKKLSDFIDDVKSSLVSGNSVQFEHLGDFSLNSEGSLQFNPQESVNFLPDSFGLSALHKSPITREVIKKQVEEIDEKVPLVISPEKRKFQSYIKYAAAAVIGIGVLGFFGYSYMNNQTISYNLAQEQEANTKLKAKVYEASFLIPTSVEDLEVVLNVPVTQPKYGKYHIVAGAYRFKENAHKKTNQLKRLGYSARYIGKNKYGLHQVVYASLENRKEAIQELRSIKKENNAKAWLLVKDLEQ